MVVDENILPVVLGRLVHFVHDAEVWVRGGDAVPPPPGFLVQRTVGVAVQVLHGAEVTEHHGLVVSVPLICGEPGRLGKDCQSQQSRSKDW